MNKRYVRDLLNLLNALLFCWLYIPHVLYYCFSKNKSIINSDLESISCYLEVKLPIFLQFLYQLHNNKYYRNVLYYRFGPIFKLLFAWYRKGEQTFLISYDTEIGNSFKVTHPFSTIINAKSIGDNFSCLHGTTIGQKDGNLPIIGNNVTLGSSVIIIGDVRIGDNVIIGAGSVVVKDIPNNCIAVGNPCKPIKFNDDK